MTSTSLQDREREHARQAVERFVNRFEPSYLLLACHAALPLVLTPELLNYLRNTFLRGQVPWVAEVDLLLSDLCSEVGYEQYVMEPPTRRYLLDVLRTHADLGPERAGEVAQLLLNYVRQLDRSDPLSGQSELQAQRWAAMAFLVDQRDALVHEIAESFRKCLASREAGPGADRPPVDLAELARLSRVAQIMAPELGEDHELIKLAKDLDPRRAPGPGVVAGEPPGADIAGERAQTAGVDIPPAEDEAPSDRSPEPMAPAAEEHPGASQEEIEGQQQLLAAHRRTLSLLLNQMAQFGGTVYTPPRITLDINEARTGIERTKSLLRGWGMTVENHPDDTDQSTLVVEPGRAPSEEAFIRQQERLAIYRRTLAQYLEQMAAQGGAAHAAPDIAQGINEMRAGIERTKSILRSWGATVEDHPDDIDQPVPVAGFDRSPDDIDIAQQQQRLMSYRHALAQSLEQLAKFGGIAYAPPYLVNDIARTRAQIQQVKVMLRAWGVAVQDLPDDIDQGVTVEQSPDDVDQGVTVEQPPDDKVGFSHQEEKVLETHRQVLAYYLQQQAVLGAASVPPSVTHSIDLARAGIWQSKQRLRSQGMSVEDLPDDEATSTPERALLQNPALRAAVLSARAGLEDVYRQIDMLATYKDLHDLLHILEFQCYNPLAREVARLSDDPGTLDRLAEYEFTLDDTIRRLQGMADRGSIAQQTAWVQALVQADKALRSGIESADLKLLNLALRGLNRVIVREPSRINTRLTDAAHSIRIQSLIESLTFIRGGIIGLLISADQMLTFDASVAELDRLYRDLYSLVDEHDRWQSVDNVLRRIEDGLEYDLSELEFSWSDLTSMMAPLYRDRSDQWSKALRADAENLDNALITQEVARIRMLFRRLRQRAGDRFFRVDTDLKQLCGRLRPAIEPLASVLRTIE